MKNKEPGFIATILYAALALSLSACASITEGTSQTISIQSADPCTISRGSLRYETTPAAPTVTLRKAREPISIECASGASQTVAAKASKAAVTGALLLDFGIVDMITGAFWKYPDNVEMGK